MSLHLAAKAARLTVLGCGWSNTPIDSGDALTMDGILLQDIADLLDYDYGPNVDWDLLADDFPDDFDWSKVIYTDDGWEPIIDEGTILNPGIVTGVDPISGDYTIPLPSGGFTIDPPNDDYVIDQDVTTYITENPDGTLTIDDDFPGSIYVDEDGIIHFTDDTPGGIYIDPDFPGSVYIDPEGVWHFDDDPLPETDFGNHIYDDIDGDGVWTNPITGDEYDGNGTPWVPEDTLIDISDLLTDIADHDEAISGYAIPSNIIPTLYGGKVTTEITIVPAYVGPDRPHAYSPAVWYIQTALNDAYIFLDAPFNHYRANSDEVEVYDQAVTLRDGSVKAVYWSSCNTRFTSTFLPSPYNSYPIQYVCWQCLYGSIGDAIIWSTSDTISTSDIQNGDSGATTVTYQGGRYYKVNETR